MCDVSEVSVFYYGDKVFIIYKEVLELQKLE